MTAHRRFRPALLPSALALSMAACSGGGGGESRLDQNTIPSSSKSAQQCAPSNDYAPTPRTGSLATEKQWVRSYVNEAYLWYDEVPNVNSADPVYNNAYAPYSLYMYFNALKVSDKDRFSFMYPTADWLKLSGAGIEAGYGIEWLQGSSAPPRDIRIAYVQPGSPAASSGLQRGDTLVTADGVSADAVAGTADDNTRQNAMFPSSTNEVHNFVFARTGAANVPANLQSADVTKTPVPIAKVITATDGAKVGYLLFHDHIVPAEQQLIDAIKLLKAGNVTDLVLDIRYNGGGYIYIASELAYMIAGPTQTTGKVFERYTYNAKRAADTDSADSRLGFLNTSCLLDANYNCTDQSALPTLNLSRVHVITRPGTCSASEAVINGLRGADVDVRQIGGTTCGKPYGFTAKDNCGNSYFPIEFKGVNDKGFGDYAAGFTPGGSGTTHLPGCPTADDLGKPLGDVTEGMLATALAYRANGSCTPGVGLEPPQGLRSAANNGFMLRNPLRENRLLRK